MKSLPAIVFGAVVFSGCLLAGETVINSSSSVAFLLHPEGVLNLDQNIAPRSMTLDTKYSENMISGPPRVVIDQQSGPCRYASEVWVNAAHQVVRQRGILAVGSDYVILVDYFYQGPAQQLERSFTFPAGPVQVQGQSAFSIDALGHGLLVQANEPANVSAADTTVHFASDITPPSRLATALLAWKDGPRPKVETVKPALPLIVKFRISFANGRVDDVALAWESRALHIGGKEFHGWAACLQRDSTGEHGWELK